MVVTAPRTRTPRSVVALRAIGWTFLVAGGVVVLYLVYSLLFTSRETDAAQSAFADEWTATVPAAPADAEPDGATSDSAPSDDAPSDDGPSPVTEPSGAQDSPAENPAAGAAEAAEASPSSDDPTLGTGGGTGDPDRAVAILEFSRPGSRERPVAAEPLYVVGDVTLEALKSGPGHYPRSADPGEDGNFAVAGHRTTYGAPFFHLDDLRPDDEIHVIDRDGRRHTYRVREQRIVFPGDAWVVDPDPIGLDRPLLTLTTCHPRFSARQRLVVWAELV